MKFGRKRGRDLAQGHTAGNEVAQYGTLPLDGFVGPAHVSIVIGSAPYEPFASTYRKPVVISIRGWSFTWRNPST